jgi:hypothetical protein
MHQIPLHQALELYNYQVQHCTVYRQYVAAINLLNKKPNSLNAIPYLPISFFKTHDVVSVNNNKELFFKSSGTTMLTTAKHYIHKPLYYIDNAIQIFEQHYNSLQQYTILPLLPHYVAQGHSSLVYMVQYFMQASGQPNQAFYLNNFTELHHTILQLISNNKKWILFGVSYALQQFAEQYPITQKHNGIIMDTGGMKGRAKEITQAQLHTELCKQLNTSSIHSEYGMTELQSQCYSNANAVYKQNNKMNVMVRDVNDPFDIQATGRGAINIIDLANIESCSFIATEDLGEVFTDGTFKVLGRLDESDIRGCSLLAI